LQALKRKKKNEGILPLRFAQGQNDKKRRQNDKKRRQYDRKRGQNDRKGSRMTKIKAE